MSDKSKLSTESYKGVRDFYPEDMFIQKYIFDTWRKTVEKYGYEEYNASILEPSEIYKAKSGDEIVNEQTYTFKDRGEREITLRPEMTPTVARMVAAKEKELAFPLRWYSIPNVFRYEKPQRGRTREHWQLNVDFFGPNTTEVNTEIITVAYKIMKNFGAKDEHFIIRLNSRKIMDDLYDHFKLTEEQAQKVSKIIDKKNKISNEIFTQSLEEILGKVSEEFIGILSSNERFLETLGEKNKNVSNLIELIEKLQSIGIKNIVFDTTLMRGFDYYTGTVFEIYDTNPNNSRSLFGGGRFDDLLDIFGAKKVPTIGFAMGDVTTRDFLETHSLLPKYLPTTRLYICTLSTDFLEPARKLAEMLRIEGVNVSIDPSDKKVGDQIKTAHKQNIPYIVCIGEDEIKSGLYSVKNMESGEETKVKAEEIVNIIK